MHITHLKLLGFKSFVDPTELIIRPGLTGVVGPNGCGKSNLLEALRWVMGETSYKAMRGGAMEDVIFSGTQRRPARNSAEVTLTIDNAKRTAPAEFNEYDTIEIARIIERGHGSRYLVNGRETRAKDVKLLFEDAATGARSHALVRQGQIGEIVNAKPQARRRILEDAAGIAGLHTRRHDAELRLSAAEDNLARLGDLIGQMEAQLSSLRRQARQAERYKELGHNLRQLQALALYLKWQEQGQKVEQAELDLKNVLTRLGELTLEETQALTLREQLQQALQPARLEETKAAAGLERLKAEQEALAKEEAQAGERQEALTAQLGEAQADLIRDEHLIKEGTDVAGKLEVELANIAQRRDQLTELLDQKNYVVEESLARLSAAEEALTALQDEHTRAQMGLDTIENERRQQIERCAHYKTRKDQIAQDLAALDADGLLLDVSPLDTDIHALETQLSALTPMRDQSRSGLEKLQEERLSLRATRDQTALNLQALNTEIGLIEHLLEGTAAREAAPVIEGLHAEKGYETALWAALGDELDSPLEDAVEARDGERLSAFWRHLPRTETVVSLPGGVRSLSEFVSGPAALDLRLAAIGVVDDTQGPLLQSQLLPGQALVSRSGGYWRWDGFVRSPDKKNRPPKRLVERGRLPGLLQDRDTLQKSLAQLEMDFSKVNEACASHEQKSAELEAQATGLQQRLQETFSKQQDLILQQQERAEEQARLSEALIHCTQELESAEKRAEALKLQKNAAGSLEELSLKVGAQKADVQEKRDVHAKAQIDHATLSSEATLMAQRCQEIQHERERWQARAVEAQDHVQALTARIEKLEAALKEFENLPQTFMERRQDLLTKVSAAETARAEAADRLAKEEGKATQHEQKLRRLQASLMDAREDKARVEARLEGARTALIEMADSIEKDFSVKAEAALSIAGCDDDAALPPLADVEGDIERVKRDRDRLGAVNLRAVEEIQALESQFQSMTDERDDLERAVGQLRRAVQQLNEEGRQRLLAAFEEVNAHFKRLFQTLFAGGEAQLQLVESDDPLDAGLEIVARPPGKKPQVLTLLSGGEKALTALSLIFAVFLTNPSPICVLDEVDAPLDDSNVDRFCVMMEEMARATDTRFLVITHHPMTMERMDRLFGVTMSEKGVSQLVSVDLAGAEALRESA